MSTALILSNTPPRLPTELVTYVFDLIAADRDWLSLKTCCLLSHEYFRYARKLLFCRITLRFRFHPSPILIRDIARRIHGLCEMLQRDPDVSMYIKTFTLLDSYPVYDSQWITQQASLPRLIGMLTSLRECTFGCDFGYMTWSTMRPPLVEALQRLFRRPQLKMLTLCNMDQLPISTMRISVPYLNLNNISLTLGEESQIILPVTNSQLCYMNVRTISTVNAMSAWEIMQIHAKNLKMIKWRCWEDVRVPNVNSFLSTIDVGKLPSLKKLCVRMSYGKYGRDLAAFCGMLESTTSRSSLVLLDLAILFPHQSAPHAVPEILNAVHWNRLAIALIRREYSNLRRVTLELTVQERVSVSDGKRVNSVAEFRKKMMVSLRPLLNISLFHFKFKVRAFHISAHE